VKAIQALLLLHYAGLDKRINDGIAEFEGALKQAGKPYELHLYEGVTHAFNNDTSEAHYNKAAADLDGRAPSPFSKTSWPLDCNAAKRNAGQGLLDSPHSTRSTI